MRKILILTAVIFTAGALKAQQDPQFTHFFQNKLNYNPAFAGTESKICGLLIYRTQWLGFGGSGNNQLDVPKGESPSTFLFNINSPIGQKFGIGLNIYNDRQGFENTIAPTLSLSYRHTFQNQSQLSGGLGVGIVQKNLAGDKLRPKQTGDALIPTGSVSGMGLDLNFGLYYTMPTLWRFNDFYTGYSITHLNQANVAYNSIENRLVMHHYFMTGASYDINGTFAVEPNLLIKSDMTKTSADINAMVSYNNKLRAGLTYRVEDAISILLGFKFSSDMQFGYSYDLTTSNIMDYSNGSHEVFFRYCFMPKIKTKEPIIIPRLTPRFL